MIFLAITAAGLNDAMRTAATSDAIWCGADAISESEYAATAPANVTRFVYELGDRTRVETAVWTIEEHHPGQTIWIETSPSS